MLCVALSTWRTAFRKQLLAVFSRPTLSNTKRILQINDILFAVLCEVTGHPDKSAILGDEKYKFDRKLFLPGAQQLLFCEKKEEKYHHIRLSKLPEIPDETDSYCFGLTNYNGLRALKLNCPWVRTLLPLRHLLSAQTIYVHCI